MNRDREPKESELSDVSELQPNHADPPVTADGQDDARASRRRFITRAGKTIAYAAPVVLLFKPKEAIAASGGGSAATPG